MLFTLLDIYICETRFPIFGQRLVLNAIGCQKDARGAKKNGPALGTEIFDMTLHNPFINLQRPKNIYKLVLKNSKKIFSVTIKTS